MDELLAKLDACVSIHRGRVVLRYWNALIYAHLALYLTQRESSKENCNESHRSSTRRLPPY